MLNSCERKLLILCTCYFGVQEKETGWLQNLIYQRSYSLVKVVFVTSIGELLVSLAY